MSVGYFQMDGRGQRNVKTCRLEQSITSFPSSENERRKLAWLGHVARHDSLSKTILQGTLDGGPS